MSARKRSPRPLEFVFENNRKFCSQTLLTSDDEPSVLKRKRPVQGFARLEEYAFQIPCPGTGLSMQGCEFVGCEVPMTLKHS